MTWTPLSHDHKAKLNSNLAWLSQLRPQLHQILSHATFLTSSVEIQQTEDQPLGVRLKAPDEKTEIVFPLNSSHLIQSQFNTIQSNFQKGVRFQIISGIGAGHALINSKRLLNHYHQAAIAVIEPDLRKWVVMLSLCEMKALWENEKIFLFAGPDAEQQFVDFLNDEYVYLLPGSQISYVLGSLSSSSKEKNQYIQLAKSIASQIEQKSNTFDIKTQEWLDKMATPSTTKIESVWSCVARAAYIHYPLAQAFINGFKQAGLEASLDPFDDAFTTNFKIVGHLIESKPGLIFTINTLPAELLQDIGFDPDVIKTFQHPRVCWMVDNTTLYEDTEEKWFTTEQDWIFYAERTYQSWIAKRSSNTAFLPPATMFDKPGQHIERFRSPISYVGSLPHVAPYLHHSVVELLQIVEKERQRDYTQSFSEHLSNLLPSSSQWQALQHSAHAFCATTQKGFKTSAAELEYFLYNCATYFKRKQIVLSLLPIGLRVFGHDAWLNELPPVYRDRYGGFIQRHELADCYASADICLNIHSHQCPTCLNTRDFDVPMAGSVVLGDWVADAGSGLLSPDEEFVLFHHEQDAVDIANDLLNDQDRLESLRTNGHNRVKREHTYQQRAKEVLDLVLGA